MIVVPAIATPYYHNGNIFDYVSLYANADLLNLMYQASSAFVHIHSKNIVHGDICPVSFLLVSWHWKDYWQVNLVGELVHRQRRDDAPDRHSRGHAGTPRQQRFIRSIKMDVQISWRIRTGRPHDANGCLLVRGYHIFSMEFISSCLRLTDSPFT